MCESNVYLRKGNKEKLLLENVGSIIPQKNGIIHLSSILGGKKEIKAEIENIDLLNHKVVLRKIERTN
jgi:predicted RNA-binding protein